jgi:hypothetical protein
MRVPIHDLEVLIMGTFRYSLGRKSYVVGETIDLIMKYRHCIPSVTKDLIKRDILRALETDRAGMDMDREDWTELLEVL